MRKGFTLVELLIVVAIIALLLAILVPSMGRAKDLVYQIMCQKNLYDFGEGIFAYASDERGYLVYCNWITIDGGRNNAPGWLYKPPRPNPVTEQHLRLNQLWPYIRNAKTWRCPAEEKPWNLGPTNAITSYMMNGAVNSYGGQPYPHKQYAFDGDAICIWECDEANIGANYNDGSSYPWENLTKRHQTGATVACFGGRADWITYEEYQQEVDNRNKSRLWCQP